MNELLKGYPGIFEIRVAWGEMDAFQHINNVAYFRYFESARIDYFQRISYMQHVQNEGIGPILASISCTYKVPLTFPDLITVGTRVTRMEDDRFVIRHVIYSSRLDKITTQSESLIVSYDYQNNCKISVPESLRKMIFELEAKAGNNLSDQGGLSG